MQYKSVLDSIPAVTYYTTEQFVETPNRHQIKILLLRNAVGWDDIPEQTMQGRNQEAKKALACTAVSLFSLSHSVQGRMLMSQDLSDPNWY